MAHQCLIFLTTLTCLWNNFTTFLKASSHICQSFLKACWFPNYKSCCLKQNTHHGETGSYGVSDGLSLHSLDTEELTFTSVSWTGCVKGNKYIIAFFSQIRDIILGIRIKEDALPSGKVTLVVSVNVKIFFLNMKEIERTSVDANYWTPKDLCLKTTW